MSTPGDVRVDAAGNVHAVHFGAILGIAEHALRRHDAGLQNRLVVIDVVQERVQRLHALLQAAVEQASIRPPEMMRGTMSNGISRSVPESSPYTANVMPTRWNARSASSRFCAIRSVGRAVEPAGEGLVLRGGFPRPGIAFRRRVRRDTKYFSEPNVRCGAGCKSRAKTEIACSAGSLPFYPQERRQTAAPVWGDSPHQCRCAFCPGHDWTNRRKSV